MMRKKELDRRAAGLERGMRRSMSPPSLGGRPLIPSINARFTYFVMFVHHRHHCFCLSSA